MRCDDCGRFCTRLHDVYTSWPAPSIDRGVCDECWDWANDREANK